uniref:Translocation protein SEC63 n=1 Tax=Kwoniella dejecticola CBS 10117 TaxID=1296121 RepID=A0A1A6AAH9_9TREE|nr:translocation protein SEC63 [Kwoniella dejecticola CBS 10117]OBR87050.1 translocation protein SEC63 [Kwoniella dejecticola CBS 10117]
MAPGISYDESGSLASYFGVTFLAIVLIPWTLSSTRSEKKKTLQPLCPCPECTSSPRRVHSIKSTKRKRKFLKKAIPLAIGWGIFAYLSYALSQAPRLEGETIYNPFEILGLSDSSNEKQIKKHYKKLSLQFHPDKIKLAENQTKEDAEQKFVELTKAYKSLTDEVTRENLAKYGNPDGPQQREDKIAIPQWVVEGKNSIWVLGAYGLVLGGGIPWVVGRWWFAQRKLTRDGILNPTAEIFFHQLRDDTDFFSLMSLLASALEFGAVLGNKKRGSKKERKERQSKIDELEKVIDARKAEIGLEENPLMRRENKVNVTTAVAKRARALLWAHLLRIDLNDHRLESEKLAVLRVTPPLLSALLNISLAHNWLATSLLVIKLQPALVQALPTDLSPLAQLPDITPEQGIELQIVNKAEGSRWLEKWIKTEKKGVSEQAVNVAKYWPRLEIIDAEFKVGDETLVTPSSIVELTYKARYVYPTTPLSLLSKPKALLPNGDHKEEAADSVADVEDSVTQVEEEKETPAPVDDKKKVEIPPNGFAHAPHWPQLRKPHFYVLLGDSKLDKVIVPPFKITDIPLPKMDGTPSEPKEFTLQFQAPPQANLYSFVAHWRSDTFLGSDVQVPIMLKVEDTPQEEEMIDDDDDDISEPEEDTLAGQMAMMRGGKVKPSAVHGDDADSSEDEGEYESESDEETPAKSKRVRAYNEDSDTDSD